MHNYSTLIRLALDSRRFTDPLAESRRDVIVHAAASRQPESPSPTPFSPTARDITRAGSAADRCRPRAPSLCGWCNRRAGPSWPTRLDVQVRLPRGRDRGCAAIGYWLASEARDRGAATQAVRLLARWAFAELGLARLELTCGPQNEASQRVAERCGFTREGLLRSHVPFKGALRESVIYSLLPGELRDHYADSLASRAGCDGAAAARRRKKRGRCHHRCAIVSGRR